MADPTFNPEQFLNTAYSEANSTELVPVPEGEYIAVSGGIGPDSFKKFKIGKGERAGQDMYRLDVEWTINDDSGQLKELLGREAKVRQGIMLDMSKDGTLDFGKGRNVSLGRLRAALGQNLGGKPWSFSSVGGQVAKIKVKHRIDGDRTYVEVADVTAAS